jgi:hypothetical protein
MGDRTINRIAELLPLESCCVARGGVNRLHSSATAVNTPARARQRQSNLPLNRRSEDQLTTAARPVGGAGGGVLAADP